MATLPRGVHSESRGSRRMGLGVDEWSWAAIAGGCVGLGLAAVIASKLIIMT